MQEEVVDELLSAAYETRDATFNLLVENFGGKRDDSALAKLICDIHKFSQSSANPQNWLENAMADEETAAAELVKSFQTSLIGIRNDYRRAIRISHESGLDKYEPHLRAELETIRNIAQAQTWDEVHSRLNSLTFERMPAKSKDADSEAADLVKKIRTRIKADIKKIQDTVFFADFQQMQADSRAMKPQLECLCNLVKTFAEKFTERKTAENLLDFNDLEHLTIKLLKQNAPEIAAKFDEIYIDEFQDTNSAQSFIFEKLAEHTQSFIVGDAKQSIYGFRNAEPKIFLSKIEQGDGVVHLSHNFRSSPQVIADINHIFQTVMSEKVGDITYNESHALVAGRPHEPSPPLEIHLIEPPTTDEETDEESMFLTTIEREAQFVTSRIIELVETEKSLNYGDIAIISRQTQTAGVFAEALTKAGIPVICDDSTGFFAADEIADTLSLLRIIDNQWQDIPLIAAMRSRLFNFTDDELAEIRLKTPDAPFFTATENFTSPKTHNFTEQINAYITQSKSASLTELIDSIVYNSNIVYDANLQLMRQYAAQFESEERKSLHDFISYIDSCIEKKLDFATPRTTAPDSNAVQIMTIHKSKGLEFKAVFLVGCGKKFNMRDSLEPVLYDFRRGIATEFRQSYLTRPTINSMAIKAAKRTTALSEEMRILYVALTRAESRLFVYGSVRNAEKELEHWQNLAQLKNDQLTYYITNQQRFIDWLGISMPKNVTIHTETPQIRIPSVGASIARPPAEATSHARSPVSLPTVGAGVHARPPASTSSVGTTCGRPPLPLKASVSEILSWDETTANTPLPPIAPSTAYRGRVVHFVMQNLDFTRTNSPEEIAAQLTEMVAKKMLEEEDVALVKCDKIAEFFASTLGQRLKNAIKVEREVKFFTELKVKVPQHLKTSLDSKSRHAPRIEDTQACRPQVNGFWEAERSRQFEDVEVHVQGVIDCYFEEPDGIVILDYKTGKTAAIKPQSAKQIEIYSQALSKILGKKIKESFVYGGL